MTASRGEAARVTVHHLVAIPGDGVGPEVVAAAREVLEAVADASSFALRWTEVTAGGAGIEAYGRPIRDEDLAVCGAADAILLGAVGGPRWDDPNATVRPEQALFALRGGLGLFANLRPVTVQPVLLDAAPVKRELLEGVDLLIVRELTGGLYFGRPSEERRAEDGTRHAVDTLAYSEAEIRRVVRLGFELAGGRRGRLTSVDKANVLASSRLWRKVVEELRPEYPDVEVGHQLVDSCAMLLVRRPAAFDVLVTENLFGDILSDEASVLAGSLGMLPSASLGERRTAHGTFGLYEPIHGSAPDIAGRDVVNPLATILSAAMLLRWSLDRGAEADAVERAVGAALADGYRTPDLLPPGVDQAAARSRGLRPVGTHEMAAAVIARLDLDSSSTQPPASPSAEPSTPAEAHR
ncbi:MAG TPA: 3-isopropylmalate dehydrogenase [Candidatus Limnocylindrales bacterium]